MKKTLITVLVVIALVLALLVAGAVGYLWYRNNHVFVEGTPYPIDAQGLDLRQEDISFAHYDELTSLLPDCPVLWNVPFQGNKLSNDAVSVTVTDLTAEDIGILEKYFSGLETVEASGCHNYPMLEVLKAQLPYVRVNYQVSLGTIAVAPDATELVLEVGDYDLETLTENLLYLPKVKSLKLKTPELTAEQVDSLRAAYPEIAIGCTAVILCVVYDTETTELDLSDLASSDVAEVIEKLPLLPGLTHVDLTGDNQVSTLSKADAKALMEAAPGVVFDYRFDFYGLTLSTAEEEVHIKNKKIGDEGEEEIRLALDLMKNCRRFVLEYCQVSNEVLAKIREDYRDQTKVVWRVNFGKGTTLTDAEIIRAVYDLVDDNCHDLVYCEDARFMDLGHNEWLDACDFVAGMPNLEAVILSGSPIKSLEPFRSCKKLKFLEVAFCEYLTDASPLAECTSLEMLNISNTHIVDLSPLDELPLTRMVARMWTTAGVNSRVPVEEQTRFQAAQPECESYFSDKKNPYGPGWRYTEDGKDYLEYYAMLRDVFRYSLDPAIPNHVGWYLE